LLLFLFLLANQWSQHLCVVEHWPLSPGTSPSSGRFHDSQLRVPPSPQRAPLSPYRISLSPQHSRREPLNLTLSQIYKITQNFSKDHMIGEGGFGFVYRAELPNGRIVAIKRAKKVLVLNFYLICCFCVSLFII
jgi:hypothetical protein